MAFLVAAAVTSGAPTTAVVPPSTAGPDPVATTPPAPVPAAAAARHGSGADSAGHDRADDHRPVADDDSVGGADHGAADRTLGRPAGSVCRRRTEDGESVAAPLGVASVGAGSWSRGSS